METKFFKAKNRYFGACVDNESFINPYLDQDHLFKFALFHKRYSLKNDTNFNSQDFESWNELYHTINEAYSPIYIKLIYMHDHGAIRLSSEDFGCNWDSGIIGFMFVDSEQMQLFGTNENYDYDKALKETLNGLNNYHAGNNFICSEYEKVNNELIEVDSCCGFIVDDEEQAISEFSGYELSELQEIQVSEEVTSKLKIAI